MKKLISKDKKIRHNLEEFEKNYFILKSIYKNLNFMSLTRWKAFEKLKRLTKLNSYTSISNRCIISINKKRFSKLTQFSRHIFLKRIRSGNISGFKKSSW